MTRLTAEQPFLLPSFLIFTINSFFFGSVAAVCCSGNSVGHPAPISVPLSLPPINMMLHSEHSKQISRQHKPHAEQLNREVASPPQHLKKKHRVRDGVLLAGLVEAHWA